ncbi:TPR end-of-group domain-containing protein [Pedobacter sp.]|uniref:TPR end-of-group domain-containing protein n=1 Tax=Pedobacter sp. TaxID=1411316 RepID=UPI003D7F3CA4
MNKTLLKTFTLSFAISSMLFPAFSQNVLPLETAVKLSDSLYNAKQFTLATPYYGIVAEISDFKSKKAGAYYNMACCLSLQGKTDSAMLILNKAIDAGYNNKSNIISDSDLKLLHSNPTWAELVERVPERKKMLNDDPRKSEFITSDIYHFWEAYDQAMKDTANFKAIMKKLYFDRASKGMEDYMGAKVSSIDFFIDHIRSAPKLYAAIRNNTYKTDAYKPAFMASYLKMKSLYAQSKFPDVYFVIGAFTSGGTVTDLGLLLGVNQAASDPSVPVDELSFQKRTRLGNIEMLPNLLAHELVHYQQDGMKKDTTTLSYVIREGMGDFIGELISGNTANKVLFDWVKGKEKQIWNKFKPDMYFDRYDNWIANSKTSTPDNLPDQGYWIGYQICKAYYEQSKDKKQAIHDMLHIQDYKAFLNKSKWEKKVAAL